MNEQQDHPYIENLPLEVDGKLVREVVRKVFRNAENGTPDAITRAGCIALALKGKEAWNAWREMFPNEFPTRKKYAPTNCVNFRNTDLSEIDFHGFKFGDYANFSGTNLGISGNFSSTVWGKQADFSGMYCDGVSFTNSVFNGAALFERVSCESWISFQNTIFRDFALFNGSHFKSINLQANFYKKLQLNAVQVDSDINLSVFDGSETLSALEISGSSLKKINLSGREFCDGMIFGKLNHDLVAVRHSRSSWDLDDLSLSCITINIPRGEITKLLCPPVFHGCKLHQDTTFEGTEFPPATGNESAARAYRTLKLAFSQQQAIREEQRFFKLEMAEETAGAKWFQNKAPYIGAKPLYLAYQWFSDFGFSVARPLILLLAVVLLFSQVFGNYSTELACNFSDPALGYGLCHVNWNWLQYSLAQSLPLPGLDKLPVIEDSTINVAAGWLVLHKIISLAALFLAGLALRNLFKLK